MAWWLVFPRMNGLSGQGRNSDALCNLVSKDTHYFCLIILVTQASLGSVWRALQKVLISGSRVCWVTSWKLDPTLCILPTFNIVKHLTCFVVLIWIFLITNKINNFHMFTGTHILCFVKYVMFCFFFFYGQLCILSCDKDSKTPGQSFKIV